MAKYIAGIVAGALVQGALFGSTITWVGPQAGNHDMNDSSNWDPGSVPGSSDTAVFDSTIPGVAKNPVDTAQSFPFNVGEIEFAAAASPFTLSFEQTGLYFQGSGITGTNTNTSIVCTNVNNNSGFSSQVAFLGSTGQCGSATITATNSGTANVEGIMFSAQIHSVGPFSMSSNGSFDVSNNGTDTAMGTGAEDVGLVASLGQIALGDTLSVGNGCTWTVANAGTYTGSNSSSSNLIGCIIGRQVAVGGAAVIGNDFSLTATNEGVNSGSTVGGSYIGACNNGAQVEFQSTLIIGNDAQFSLLNSGNASCTNSNSADFTGYIVDEQFHVAGTCTAGDRFQATAINTGTITSSAGTAGQIVANIDSNSGTSGSQIEFGGSSHFGDNASIQAINSGTYGGPNTLTGNSVANMNRRQLSFVGNVTAGDALSLAASNSAGYTGTGVGGNAISAISSDQIGFEGACTIGDGATITVSNSATYSGSNTSAYISVGSVAGSQLGCSGPFQAGDNLTCTLSNSATDASHDCTPANFIGALVGNGQAYFNSSCHLGSNASFSITNQANYSGDSNQGNGGYVGSTVHNAWQFYAGDSFSAGDGLSLIVENDAVDSSTNNNSAVYVGSFLNESTVLFGSSCTVNGGGEISATNKGTYTGSYLTAGDIVAGINGPQIDFTGPVTSTGGLLIKAVNEGHDSSSGTGGGTVCNVSGAQIHFAEAVALGDGSGITVTNSGEYTGTNATDYIYVGALGTSQVLFNDTLTAGNELSIHVSNTGSASTDGINKFVGFVPNSQAYFVHGLTAGDGMSMTISNLAVNSGNSNNLVGHVAGDQCTLVESLTAGDDARISLTNIGLFNGNKTLFPSTLATPSNQLNAQDRFNVGDRASLSAVNLGFDLGGGTGNAQVAVVPNQFNFQNGLSFGEESQIEIANIGLFSLNDSSTGNETGHITGNQLLCSGGLTGGSYSTIEIINVGICTTNSSSNNVGVIDSEQLLVTGITTLGDGVTISVANSGTSNGQSVLNQIGVINSSQALFEEDFFAGSDLTIRANNTQSITGISNNSVGSVLGSQIEFVEQCVFGNGSLIAAHNSGYVEGDQILFEEGFQLTGGRARLLASNSGIVGGHGITVLGNTGGDVEVSLFNSSLYVDTDEPTFTVGALYSDSLSTVQCKPTLIVATDPDIYANFAGNIENFTGEVGELIKQGAGTQILSGINTYTGNTTVEAGVLAITGSIAGNLETLPGGTLKGTGTIGGSVTNQGTIAPGMSIGTLTILNDFSNPGGTYDAEISADGACDLIAVGGVATLNGGKVSVTSTTPVYNFQHPYTLLQARQVTGKFSGVSGVELPHLMSPHLTYLSDRVLLTLQQHISRAAETHNEYSVAKRLDALDHPNAEQNRLLNAMVQSTIPEVRSCLEEMSGFQHAADIWLTEQASRQFIRRLFDPVRELVTDNCCGCGCRFAEGSGWFEVDGGAVHLKKNHNTRACKASDYEVIGGVQCTVRRQFALGAALGWRRNQVHYHHSGSGHSDIYQAGLFGAFKGYWVYGLVDVAYAYSQNEIKRAMHIGDLHFHAHSHPRLHDFYGYAELGLNYRSGLFMIQPFVGVQTGAARRDKVKEHQENGFGLSIHDKNWDTTSSRLGFHLTHHCACDHLSVDLAWNYLFRGASDSLKSRFTHFGSAYTLEGYEFGRNSVDYAVTFTRDCTSLMSVYLEANGESASRAYSYSVIGGFTFKW